MSSMSHPRTGSAFERKDYELEITDNLEHLLAALPEPLVAAIGAADPHLAAGGLIEIVMDLGRRPEARFQGGEVEIG